ncbi:MAG: hypothetical protein JXA49_01230, partial [Actinobacteria bacterium]|nr:hypothetical protein [Actinomycetota bacterium]
TMLLNARRIPKPPGAIQMILLAIEDITDRCSAEETLKRVNIELESYAWSVSHDLKGPIGAASMALDIITATLEKVKVPREKAEKLKKIITAGQGNLRTANSIITNLLALAEAGGPQDTSPVDVQETIDMVLANNTEMIEEKGTTVEVVSPLGQVVASPTQIYQLFANLIVNSIKHSESENPIIEISSLGTEGTTHRFLVRDNGQGIPEEILGDLFTPFVKAHSDGSGIGLLTVERIVKTCGGEIRAYNDNGACFEFDLRDSCQK